MDPLISIIIPAYNLESYIERTIKSVLAQKYNNIEVLIIDNNSTDNTKNIIKKYSEIDKRVHYFFEKNKGPNRARLRGIYEAHGDYLSFIDGDDTISPDMLKIMSKELIEKDDYDFIRVGFSMIYPTGKQEVYYGTGKRRIRNTEQNIYDLLVANDFDPALWLHLYKTKIIKLALQERIFDDSICFNEDLLLNYCIYKNSGKSLTIDLPLYNYILRPNSATDNKSIIVKYQSYIVFRLIYSDLVDEKLKSVFLSRLLRLLFEIKLDKLSMENCPNIIKEDIKKVKHNIKTINKSNKVETSDKLKLIATIYFTNSMRIMVHIVRKIRYGSGKYSR